jgi:hypothetical protein
MENQTSQFQQLSSAAWPWFDTADASATKGADLCRRAVKLLLCILFTFSLFPFIAAFAKENNDAAHLYRKFQKSGKFSNLEINEPNVSSHVVQLAGGGLAVEMETNGSRSEYSAIAPIVKHNGSLFVNCLYKAIYDSIDGSRLVGSSCNHVSLEKFDPESALDDSGLLRYKSGYKWLGRIFQKKCPVLRGIEYGNYMIALCAKSAAPIPKDETVAIINKSGNVLFLISGYTFIPGMNLNNFILYKDENTRTSFFIVKFDCLKQFKAGYSAHSAPSNVKSSTIPSICATATP